MRSFCSSCHRENRAYTSLGLSSESFVVASLVSTRCSRVRVAIDICVEPSLPSSAESVRT